MERSAETKPRLKDFARYALPTPHWHMPLGVLLELVAWAVLALGLYYTSRLLGPGRGEWFWVRYLLLLAMFVYAVLLWLGRALRVNTREKLLDEREPILYLRPFSHENRSLAAGDEADSSPRWASYTDSAARALYNLLGPAPGVTQSVTTNDDALAKALKDIGPLVAVGLPRETLPPHGALRLYFSDEEWREKVGALMTISRLVIIQAGYTSGVEWEMEAARRHFRPDQVYISFLDWGDLDYETRKVEFSLFQMQAERVYGISPPEHLREAYLICFDDDWTPFGITVSWWRKIPLLMAFQTTAAPAVREIFRPVLRARGIKLRAWRTAAFVVITHTLYAVFFYYLINLFVLRAR